MKPLMTLVAIFLPILAFGADAVPKPPLVQGESPGATSSHAYFKMLAAHPNMVLTKAFSSASLHPDGPEQEIADSYVGPSSGAYNPDQWHYDPVEDAVKQVWPAQETSMSGGNQLRWGNTGGYNEVSRTSFGALGTGTFFFVWEWKVDENWTISRRQANGTSLVTHKAFQFASNDDDLTLEPRFRYTGSSSDFPGPSGSEYSAMDMRTYITPEESRGPGDSVPNQLAAFYPEAGEWMRLFVFLDGANTTVSFWGQTEGGPLVQMYDRSNILSTSMRNIDSFWFELNSSQDTPSDTSGIPVESYMWGRNWTVLDDLSYAEAEALVRQSSW